MDISFPLHVALSISPLILLLVLLLLCTLTALNGFFFFRAKKNNVPKEEPESLFKLQHYLHNIELQLRALGQQKEADLDAHPSNTTYRVAKKIFASGGNMDEVLKNCNLTRGEAELIAVMQSTNHAS